MVNTVREKWVEGKIIIEVVNRLTNRKYLTLRALHKHTLKWTANYLAQIGCLKKSIKKVEEDKFVI